MKRRIKKKLIRNGVCPICKGCGGMSYWDLATSKRSSNMCTSCFHAADIIDNDVQITFQPEFKKNYEEADKQPLSPSMRQLMKNVGLSEEDIEALEEDE